MEFTTTIIYIMVIIIIMQFLLHIHKKNLFLLPIPTELAFNATILYPTLQDSIFQQSISRCGVLLNHRKTALLW